MAERALITLDETDEAARDIHDMLIVIGLVLNAESEPLQPRSRDAFATMVRLAVGRAEVVHMGLDDLRESRR